MEQHDERRRRWPAARRATVVVRRRGSVAGSCHVRSVTSSRLERPGKSVEHGARRRAVSTGAAIRSGRPTGVRVRPVAATHEDHDQLGGDHDAEADAAEQPRPAGERTRQADSRGDQPPDPADQQRAGDGGGHDRGHADRPGQSDQRRREGPRHRFRGSSPFARRSKIASARAASTPTSDASSAAFRAGCAVQ